MKPWRGGDPSGGPSTDPGEGRAEPSPAQLCSEGLGLVVLLSRCPFGGAGTALTLTAEPSSFSAAWAQRGAAGKLRPGGAPHLLREEAGGPRFCCPQPPAPRPAGLLALPAPPSRGWPWGWRQATATEPGQRRKTRENPAPALLPRPQRLLATPGGHDLADRQL